MRYQYLDARLRQAFDDAGLDRGQRALLQGVLRALDPDAHLGEHVAGLNSAFLAVTRAQTALDSHATEDQPRWNLLRRIITTSLACMDAAAPAYVHGGAKELAEARQTLLDVDAAIAVDAQKLDPQVTAAAARKLDPRALETAVRQWITPLWNGVELPLRARMIAEVAVVVAVHGRDGRQLRSDLLRWLKKPGDDLEGVLWPEPRRHVVALVVRGARVLRHLDALLPRARQEPLHRNRLPKDDFLKDAVEGSSVLVRLPVDAADAHTAALRGRRMLSEALDQYAAGERLTELNIAPLWQVSGPTGRVTRGAEHRRTVGNAYPLTAYWPADLRSAMRVANLARQISASTAPMASAGLAWSALEATGLDPSKIPWLAKACALQMLRQHLVSLHVIVTNHDEELRGPLDAHVPTTGVKHHLKSVDAWVEVLIRHNRPKEQLKAAQDAVTALAENEGGLVQDLVEVWRTRLADSTTLAGWLREQEDTATAVLEWLYVTRNLAFHAGRYATPADELTAQAGQAVADLTLEFLGNWRTVERLRGEPETAAVEIYRRLAQRKDQLEARLKRAGSVRRLSVEDISGPDEKWWSRTTTSS
ncbi:hypothetical protein [Lentzea flava]|uniref:Apea-like HEPN domain-containing protein n=1 Tax=Lentzea flava TaxID=103732 RepID=A0ABQ2ULY5_9PSEU|nr:hypothetical protein [Lentzea flava]MCP2200513.1 hypothetical protein [Lentzea flava]GGU42042.1 hypothetical protein GCM10010178_38210 [Lentzea flava]